METSDSTVEVLYDFEYSVKGGKKVCIKEGERLYLIKKTNDDWWQVIRNNERRPFYVPSTYVRELVKKSKVGSVVSGRENHKLTVSVNIKQKQAAFLKAANPVISSSCSNVRVLANNEPDNRCVNSCDSLSLGDNSTCDKKSAGYSVVRLPRKSASEYGEANILEEEQLSESLTELARQITFKPCTKSIVRKEFSRRLDGIKYCGSFKTKHERKQAGRARGSWPDLSSVGLPAERSAHSMESVGSDGTGKPVNNNVDQSNNNWRNDNDSEDISSDMTVSSCESLDPKFRPVAKPRHKPTPHQEEVIYANCVELTQGSLKGKKPKAVKSSEDEASGESVAENSVPCGWSTHVDTETQLTYYVHSSSGQKWYSSKDDEGRIYFFEENSSESSWTLPELPSSHSPEINQTTQELTAIFEKISSSSIDYSRKMRNMKAVSMILPDRHEEELNVNKNWPQLSEGKMYVICEGPLHFTKVSEGGKKVRKSWSSVYVVLTELFILIYKDIKSFHSLKNLPEVTIDLNGAQVGSGENVSGRKHVLVVVTLLGLRVALQCDNVRSALHWATNIQHTIQNLPKGVESCGMRFVGSLGECPEEPRKGTTSIGRSKSVNFKSKDDGLEELGATPAERQMRIRDRLRKFFNKRPSMESLVKKGIWKDEPVFGCYLEQACGSNIPRIPQFVQKCIAVIEGSPENMKTDGLYRASGNLSQIQKIRLQIDQHNYSVLEQEEDVHVLTGALKLFFRELKEPLIPFKLFPKAIKASTTSSKKEKLSMFYDIVKALPTPNRDTLKFLLQHLLRVCQFQESNRMHVNNIAIVFGPTLMWPEQESANMALDMMQQNMVIESLLNDFSAIFK